MMTLPRITYSAASTTTPIHATTRAAARVALLRLQYFMTNLCGSLDDKGSLCAEIESRDRRC
jgi:hypothetical protein